jgi:hypothetical protein
MNFNKFFYILFGYYIGLKLKQEKKTEFREKKGFFGRRTEPGRIRPSRPAAPRRSAQCGG